MPYPFPVDIQELVGRHMAAGEYASEDELLRDALRALSEEADDLAAVEAAIGEWRDGDDGIPLDDAFAAIRKQHSVGD